MAIVNVTPLASLFCPSRRPPGPYPAATAFEGQDHNVNRDKTELATKGDYSACAGDGFDIERRTFGNRAVEWEDKPNGICFHHSEVKMGQIVDGTTNTIMVGEKFMDPNFYLDVNFPEHHGMYTGEVHPNFRVTNLTEPPRQDRILQGGAFDGRGDGAFGSAHPGGFHATFCDGSVHTISYQVDLELYRRLGNREDELPVDLDQL